MPVYNEATQEALAKQGLLTAEHLFVVKNTEIPNGMAHLMPGHQAGGFVVSPVHQVSYYGPNTPETAEKFDVEFGRVQPPAPPVDEAPAEAPAEEAPAPKAKAKAKANADEAPAEAPAEEAKQADGGNA